MPLTPFHIGPALVLGLLLYRWLDLPAVLVGSVVVDVRAALVVFGVLDGPVHGPLTTFLGGGVLALAITVALFPIRTRLERVMRALRLPQSWSPPTLLAGALVGVASHVVLDAVLYADVRPFAPFPGNPFLGALSVLGVYLLCTVALVVGMGLYALHVAGWRVTTIPHVVER